MSTFINCKKINFNDLHLSSDYKNSGYIEFKIVTTKKISNPLIIFESLIFHYGQIKTISASLYSINGEVNASDFNAAYIKPSHKIKMYADSSNNEFTLMMCVFIDNPAFSFYISHFWNLNNFEVISTSIRFIEARSLPDGGHLLI